MKLINQILLGILTGNMAAVIISSLFVVVYSLLNALNVYFYEPYKILNGNLPPSFLLLVIIIGKLTWWFIQVIVIYIMAKIFKGNTKFMSLYTIYGLCVIPLIICYILNMLLTYEIMRYLNYVLVCSYYVISCIMLTKLYRISAWKIAVILVFANMIF